MLSAPSNVNISPLTSPQRNSINNDNANLVAPSSSTRRDSLNAPRSTDAPVTDYELVTSSSSSSSPNQSAPPCD
ncbi:hypothetical protein ACOSQ3_026499 [Xanthoceras sorbifolium]